MAIGEVVASDQLLHSRIPRTAEVGANASSARAPAIMPSAQIVTQLVCKSEAAKAQSRLRPALHVARSHTVGDCLAVMTYAYPPQSARNGSTIKEMTSAQIFISQRMGDVQAIGAVPEPGEVGRQASRFVSRESLLCARREPASKPRCSRRISSPRRLPARWPRGSRRLHRLQPVRQVYRQPGRPAPSHHRRGFGGSERPLRGTSRKGAQSRCRRRTTFCRLSSTS